MARTQDALYAEIDLELSWSERELPERERTKHVHRLHPYLGKFIPQLVETLLARYVPAGRSRARPVRGLRHDARAVARERPRRDRRRRRRVQLPADRGSRRPATTSSCSRSELRDALFRLGPRPSVRHTGMATSAGGSRRRRPRAARLPLADRRLRARRRPPRRARPGGALGAADDALRPRLPARAAGRPVLVPQAQARVPSGRAGRALHPPLRARHARPDQGVRARPRRGSARRPSSTGTRGSSRSAGRSTRSSPPRRTRA